MTARLVFHHLGLATKNPQKARLFLEHLGYTIGEIVHDPLQKVDLAMGHSASMPSVEIISPHETDGPLRNLMKISEELIYHVCYQTSSLEESLQSCRQAGLRLINVSPPQPAVLFGGRNVSFYHAQGVGLIEILEIDD